MHDLIARATNGPRNYIFQLKIYLNFRLNVPKQESYDAHGKVVYVIEAKNKRPTKVFCTNDYQNQ